MRLPAGLVLVALSLLANTLEVAAFQAGDGLNILLTNDDGFEAPGIVAMRQALVAAGHRVTLVAPVGNQSGTGMTMTNSGTIDYYPQEEGVWAVDGTPSDAVSLALVHMLRDDPPDLVVSGSSFGQNVGGDLVYSGTVGAAMTAVRAGIPAISISVAIDFREAERPTPFESTENAFAAAADFLVEIVRQLRETGGAGLLPPRYVLNVNYPAIGAETPEGVRFTTVSTQRSFRRVFSVAGDTGPARVEFAPGDPSRAEVGSDVALLAAGYVTVSVLDGSWDAGRANWESLLQRLIIER